MRKITYGAASSLDGFIAAADGGVDWLHFSDDVKAIMAGFWSRIDTLIMGRKTWEVAAAMGGGGGMKGIATYVFSRTLDSIKAKGVELVTGDATQFVAALKRRPGKDIGFFGGGDFAASLFRAGLIDEVTVNIHPVLLGSGTPLFRDTGRVTLKLAENASIDGGCINVTYAVVPARAKRGAPRRTARVH